MGRKKVQGGEEEGTKETSPAFHYTIIVLQLCFTSSHFAHPTNQRSFDKFDHISLQKLFLFLKVSHFINDSSLEAINRQDSINSNNFTPNFPLPAPSKTPHSFSQNITRYFKDTSRFFHRI